MHISYVTAAMCFLSRDGKHLAENTRHLSGSRKHRLAENYHLFQSFPAPIQILLDFFIAEKCPQNGCSLIVSMTNEGKNQALMIKRLIVSIFLIAKYSLKTDSRILVKKRCRSREVIFRKYVDNYLS